MNNNFKIGEVLELDDRDGHTGRVLADAGGPYTVVKEVNRDTDCITVRCGDGSLIEAGDYRFIRTPVAQETPVHFKIGDRVCWVGGKRDMRYLDLTTSPDDENYHGTVVKVGADDIRVNYDKHGEHTSLASVLAHLPAPEPVDEAVLHHLPAEAPAIPSVSKFWVIMVMDGEFPAPSERPRRYVSRSQAEIVSRIMARKHPEQIFVVFEAVASSVVPRDAATTTPL